MTVCSEWSREAAEREQHGYFEEGSDFERVERVYELFTTRDLMRKAEILLREDLGELAHTKAWNDLIHGDRDITTLAYLALRIEARRPGTVPGEMIDGLANMVDIEGKVGELSSSCIGVLTGESVEHVDEVEKHVTPAPPNGGSARGSSFGVERRSRGAVLTEKPIAISHVKRAAETGVTKAVLVEMAEAIDRDIRKFRDLLASPPRRRKETAA